MTRNSTGCLNHRSCRRRARACAYVKTRENQLKRRERGREGGGGRAGGTKKIIIAASASSPVGKRVDSTRFDFSKPPLSRPSLSPSRDSSRLPFGDRPPACEWQSYRDSRFVSRFCMTVGPEAPLRANGDASKWHAPRRRRSLEQTGIKSLVPISRRRGGAGTMVVSFSRWHTAPRDADGGREGGDTGFGASGNDRLYAVHRESGFRVANLNLSCSRETPWRSSIALSLQRFSNTNEYLIGAREARSNVNGVRIDVSAGPSLLMKFKAIRVDNRTLLVREKNRRH